MSYASLTRVLPESFRSTNGLATVASLGIHGLLLIVLPFLPFDSQLAANIQQRTVGLMELTPEEQSRLPGASSVPAALPPFAAQQSVLPPLPPPPPFPVGALPPLPDPIALPPSIGLPPPSNNSFQAALRPNQTFILPVSPQQSKPTTTSGVPRESNNNRQTFATGSTLNAPPPPPVLNTLPPPPPLGNLQPPVAAAPNQSQRPYNSGELLPPIPQWQQPTNTGLPAMRLNPSEEFSPGEAPQSQVAQTIPTPPNLIQPQQPQQPQPQSEPQQQVAAAPAETVESGPRTQQLPERGKQELLALQQRIREERATAAPPANPAPQLAEPHTAEQARQQQIVAALRNEQNTRNNDPAAQSDSTAEQARRQQLVTALRDEQNTTAGSGSDQSANTDRDAQLQAWAERQDTVQQNHSNVVTKAPIYKTIKSCQRELEGVAVLGVVVNPEGRIVSGPDFLSRQGAAGVEQAAKEYIQEYEFPKSASAVNQQFHLQYQYDTANCSQPSEDPEPQQQPEQSQPQQSDV
ncbi:hypothetical protein [Gloeocapsopsis dulcis]|uniref:TonB C-terminal domain-containing protein n=1 Tax=Gloeocapsopsis dulcis AAB1 = 1H9 TaxID=1433147 RepID=A0A6N8FZJ4_9CHRO|nr:hypothetical protein [Gloeocapsopsis dulcis]MUL37745.1 hypothetical protein [Gloeocapsopsis dulcis AAB1 = 1H9]WNN90636.1 hypothetical protein P0S91_06005 [Gloeocapsopsis dulcis]